MICVHAKLCSPSPNVPQPLPASAAAHAIEASTQRGEGLYTLREKGEAAHFLALPFSAVLFLLPLTKPLQNPAEDDRYHSVPVYQLI